MTTVDIAAMPVAEKLQLMEALWDSLSAQANESHELPPWHRPELARRLDRLDNGEEAISAWPEAKERLRAQIKTV